MSNLRVQVVESEKSPEVLQANWREQVILSRNLQVINRSRNTVVNRITVDQKIMNKRFQKKLQQSKTAYAKITGNKNLEISLRQKHTFVLNTNLGQGEEDDTNLQRIWTAGNNKIDRLLNRGRRSVKRAFSAPAQRAHDGAPIIITLSAAELGINLNREERPPRTPGSLMATPPSSLPSSRRPSTSGLPGSVSIASATLAPRPNTVAEPQRRGRSMSDITPPAVSPDPEMEGPRVAFADDPNGLHKRNASVSNLATPAIPDNALPHGDSHDNQEDFFKTVTDYMAPTPSTPSKPNTRQNSRPVGVSRAGGGGGLGMSMFEDSGEADITLLDIHRLRVRSANYTGQVKNFCQKLKELKGGQEIPVADYYTTRLIDYARSGRNMAPEWRIPGTPESETLREMGNIKMKSLTMKDLSRNYTNSQSQIAC